MKTKEYYVSAHKNSIGDIPFHYASMKNCMYISFEVFYNFASQYQQRLNFFWVNSFRLMEMIIFHTGPVTPVREENWTYRIPKSSEKS